MGIIIEKSPTQRSSSSNSKNRRKKRIRPLIRTIALEAVTSNTEPLDHDSAKERLRKLLTIAEQREVAFNKVIGELVDELDEADEEQQYQEEEEEQQRHASKRSRHSSNE